MLHRQAAETIKKKSEQYPVIAITGPRQAGKSTLARELFPEKPYISLEDLDQRAFATAIPDDF